MATPVASYVSSAQAAQDLADKLGPHIEVVHVVLDQDSALAELPAAASGQPDAPISSGLGSNANAEPESRKVPQAIIFGTGISREDIAKVQEAVAEVASGVKSVIVTEDEVDAADTDSLAQVVKAKLAAALQA